jgi:hypothetical protein
VRKEKAVELETTELIVADPIGVPRTPNVMCHSLRRLIKRVGAEIRGVAVKCRSDFSICAAIGIVGGKERTTIPHNMGGHVAAGVIYKQARHVFSEWVLKLTFRIAGFKRDQSPVPSRLGADCA